MSPAGKGSPGKGGKAPAGKAKGGKGAARGSSVPRRAATPNAAPQGRGASSRGPAALKAAPGRPPRPTERPRLRTRYASELKGTLQKDLGLPNPMLVPRMEKIVINMGVGKAVAPVSYTHLDVYKRQCIPFGLISTTASAKPRRPTGV